MTADYSKLTEVLKRFANMLPDHQTTDASTTRRLMNSVRLGHYPMNLAHMRYTANSIVFPVENTVNLVNPYCRTGDVLLRLVLGMDSQCYGIELGGRRAEQTQQQSYHVDFGSLFSSSISPGAFHAVFLNPSYLSALFENEGRSENEKWFLIESIPFLVMGGLLIYIVPHYHLTVDLCGVICDSSEQVCIRRFLDREFKQFKQVIVTGVHRRRTEAEQDAEALCSTAEHSETLLTADPLPKTYYELLAVSKKVGTFRGVVFNKDELVRQPADSTGFDQLFTKSRLNSEIKCPLLPLSIGQVGLIGGSGPTNGLIEYNYPHIVKGRIIREKHTVMDENRELHGHPISTEIWETVSNRMIFNTLTPSGLRLLTQRRKRYEREKLSYHCRASFP